MGDPAPGSFVQGDMIIGNGSVLDHDLGQVKHSLG
jgi:hypothetical protein